MSDINDRADAADERHRLEAGMDRRRVRLCRTAPERQRTELLRLQLVLPPVADGGHGLPPAGLSDLQAGAQPQSPRTERRKGLSRGLLGHDGEGQVRQTHQLGRIPCVGQGGKERNGGDTLHQGLPRVQRAADQSG